MRYGLDLDVDAWQPETQPIQENRTNHTNKEQAYMASREELSRTLNDINARVEELGVRL